MRTAPGGFDDAVGVGFNSFNEASSQAAGGWAAPEADQCSFHHSRSFCLGPSLGSLFGQQSIKVLLCRFHFPFGLGGWIVAVRASTVEKLHLFHDARIPIKLTIVHSDGGDGPAIAPQRATLGFQNSWKGKPRCRANGGLCLECRLFGWRNRADANSPSYFGAVSSSGMWGRRAQIRSAGTWVGPPPSWITARSRAPSGMWSRSKCTPRRAASVIWPA